MAAKANGDSPYLYKAVPCPDCQKPMWMGPRTLALMAGGIKATYAICAITKHGVRQEDLGNMRVLATEQKVAK